jgi:hypothetical protein
MTYLIVPSSNDHTIPSEILSIENWATQNNLKLNKTKSIEIIIHSNQRASLVQQVTPTAGFEHADSINILGVLIQNNLSMASHIQSVCNSASQSLYAIKLLKAHGLSSHAANSICSSLVTSRLTYASPAWWGFTKTNEKQQLQSILNRATRWGLHNRVGRRPMLKNKVCLFEL